MGLGLLLPLNVAVAQQTNLPPCPIGSRSSWTGCFGIITDSNSVGYAGAFQNGKEHGQGSMTFPNGDMYTGEFKDGKPDGQGTYTAASGEKYVGEYKSEALRRQGIAREASSSQIEMSDSSNSLSQATRAVGSRTVPKSSGAEWGALVSSAIRRNVAFVSQPDMVGNPQTIFRVTFTSECALAGVEKIRASGVPEWDKAVERAIRKVNPFPRFPGGICPPSIELSSRPYD
jgi:hypothetical protein